ncbi:MAG TPA: PAS domain S-box protein [Terriglobales bacterium]|nr:PAS domain S-box protein [Terriglobales bacterium]
MAETSYERSAVRAILEHPHVSVIATGQDGTIRFFNRGAENLLGYKAEEMVDKQKTLVFADPAEAAQHAEELSRQYGVAVSGGREGIISGPTITGEPEDRIWTYIRKDGSRRKVLMSLNILRDESGKMQGYIGISIPLPE